uniref:Cytochrome c oxidase assembly factor 7 n=1 Tax=Hucho hucho TaxID=62062 RepID=A0A4W5K3Q3_9TELE
DNIGVEFSYQCYREKDPEGCQRLSTTQVLKHNCEMNKHGEGFYKLGAYYVQGKGEVADNLKMAYSCFMTAYSSGGKKSVDACQNAGPDSGVLIQHFEQKCNGSLDQSKTLHIHCCHLVAKI